jgi:murein DD-endopeptidase MepM/ murein hydrolase activator NlpD
MSIAKEFPLAEEHQPAGTVKENIGDAHREGEAPPEPHPTPESQKSIENLLRYGMAGVAMLLLGTVLWGMQKYILTAQISTAELPQRAALAAAEDYFGAGAPELGQDGIISLPAYAVIDILDNGIPRYALLHTTIPSRPRVNVVTYTVQSGDTVFGIAETYGLRPETIFWGNQEVLNDDPHKLFPGQVLNILPVDGVYHKWSAGENFANVAAYYGVAPAAIAEWAGNPFDIFDFDINNPDIPAGTWLIIPGGEREFVDFGPPRITRDNPAVASTYGPGHCGAVPDGAVGTGAFIWPTTEGYLSGYDYNPAANHPGIDIAGDTGNPVWAADSGVVVYAGWSYYGYGNLVVLDHGQWQTLYAHLDSYFVSCGLSVFQGATIGTVGNTGNSSGSHLHFELMYLSAKVNPWDYISP